jgi:hypothetical protein
MRPATCLSLAALLLLRASSSVWALDTSQDTWEVLAGYGESYPGWGLTTQRVQTIDLTPRYSHLTIDKMGSGLLRGQHWTFVELPLSTVLSPDDSAMLGVNLLAAYRFTTSETWQPYVFGGGGLVYSFADIHGMGAELNGNYQFAVGLERQLSEGKALLAEIRFHHISNAGTREPNVPLNGLKFMVGFRF